MLVMEILNPEPLSMTTLEGDVQSEETAAEKTEKHPVLHGLSHVWSQADRNEVLNTSLRIEI